MSIAQEAVVDLKQGQTMLQDMTTTKSYESQENALDLALQNYIPDTDAEKKLVRKVDLFMVPMLWWMCILCYLDRNNIGNANAAGMSEDINIDDSDYSMLISIFFIAYLIFEIPSNLLLARVRPSWYLAIIMSLWGMVCACMSQVKNYSGILACRFFLGAIEAGFLPGVMFLMSAWYKKSEIGKRFSLFFTALCVAGAASGLISGAVISGLEGARGMEGWRWLFLIEGVGTTFTGLVAGFVLLDYPENSKRLTAEQRELGVVRLIHDRNTTTRAVSTKLSPLQAVRAALFDLRTYVFAILYMFDNGAATINYFVPTLLKSMGYSGVAVQWMTVPVWAVATVFLLVVPQVADRTGDRRWTLTAGFTLSFVSAIICFQVHVDVVRYVFLAFFISGLYFTLPLILTWASEVISLPAEKRAVAIAFASAVGNLSAVYGSRLWPSADAPQYSKGFTATACFTGVAAVLAGVAPILFRYLPSWPSQAELEVAESQAIEGRPGRGHSQV
ncbi:hypothetical protein H2204_005190 [Knufia peltigerae]|uniref:Major facilitator superfamily (MFS) profile domain-containing protein n=1 Tax=Knufia peltigerae TaxID=1002370 RepID=A0AA38Y5Y8_9EURO|nr:hypothetical protein H2204_005190 [Knufia peltigerae]